MNEEKVTELKEKLDIQKERGKITRNRNEKTILRLFGYIAEIVASSLLGGITTLTIIGWYPAMVPGLIGLTGPIGYIILQMKIINGVLKEKSSKATGISAIFAFFASLTSYFLGLYYGLAKIPVFGAGTIYNLYSKKKKGRRT